MKDFIKELDKELLSGIPLGAWRAFLAIFSGANAGTQITAAIADIAEKFGGDYPSLAITADEIERLKLALHEFASIFGKPSSAMP
ncbi:MAG: hypothetical protein WD942_01745 [Dehalococcoidia bacterium]